MSSPPVLHLPLCPLCVLHKSSGSQFELCDSRDRECGSDWATIWDPPREAPEQWGDYDVVYQQMFYEIISKVFFGTYLESFDSPPALFFMIFNIWNAPPYLPQSAAHHAGWDNLIWNVLILPCWSDRYIYF